MLLRRSKNTQTTKRKPRGRGTNQGLPYYLFPWADTDFFAAGRPPTQSDIVHMRKQKNDGWLHLNAPAEFSNFSLTRKFDRLNLTVYVQKTGFIWMISIKKVQYNKTGTCCSSGSMQMYYRKTSFWKNGSTRSHRNKCCLKTTRCCLFLVKCKWRH